MALRSRIFLSLALTVCFLSIILLIPLNIQAAEIALGWTRPDDSRIAGYKIYYGEQGTNFLSQAEVIIDSAGTTSCNISDLSEGQTYEFAATSFDANGYESNFCETISYRVPTSSTDSGEAVIIPRSQMSIVSFDSQELSGENGAAVNSIDGNEDSIWHTEWSNSQPSHPHELVIDLGAVYDITKLYYLPRQDGSYNGMIAGYEVYVSQDGSNWGQPVDSGFWTSSSSLKEAVFAGKTGQYIKLIALSEVNGNPWTSAAEISIEGTEQQSAGYIDNDEDGYSIEEGDCDDNDPTVYPGAEEICGDGIDQNCDGSDLICPGDIDNDGDGFSVNQGDCNDDDPTVFPGATEICGDGIDQDCNGSDLDCIPGQQHDELTLEVNEIEINHQWKTISFSKMFYNPVVVVKPLSINGNDPAVVRVRNVTPEGFEVRIQEWDYLDGWHLSEKVGYIVLEQGRKELPGGIKIEAGTFETNNTAAVSFQQAFTVNPIIICSITSENDIYTITGRVNNISREGFDFSLQTQESHSDAHQGIETISYIAWEPSAGTIDGITYLIESTFNEITNNFHQVVFYPEFSRQPIFIADMQTRNGMDTANVRWRNKTVSGVEIQIDEEQSREREVNHTTEVVGYMAFAGNSSEASLRAISPEEMSIFFTDSEELIGENGAAANAIDGNEDTIWHTQWYNSRPMHPHEIVIDLGGTFDVGGLSYLPRQDSSENGMIAGYEVYISQDGSAWEQPVDSEAWENSRDQKEIDFPAKTGRYLKLRSLSEVNGNPWASAAEITVFAIY
jgi:hypothetical protein